MAREATQRPPRSARANARTARAARRTILRMPWLALGLAVGITIGAYLLCGSSTGRGAGEGPVSTLTTADFHALAFSPDSPETVFFGHHNGMMRSDDGGRTWRPLVDRRNFDAMGLGIGGGGSRLYLAGHDVFQVSTDVGASWQPARNNLPGTDIHGFAMSPSDSNRLYAFVVGFGAFRSTDGGATWESLPGRLPEDVMSLAAAGGEPDTLFAGSMSSGGLRSTDGGQSWSRIDAAALRGVMAVAVDRADARIAYAGVEGGLYKTTDAGSSWSKLPFPGANAVAIAVSPGQPNVVLAITVKDRKGLVYRSEDGGATWGGKT